jgi:hypothetical protein
MKSPTDPRPGTAGEESRRKPADEPEPGSNAVEHEPDPKADPIPDGDHRYIRRSPYTAGND